MWILQQTKIINLEAAVLQTQRRRRRRLSTFFKKLGQNWARPLVYIYQFIYAIYSRYTFWNQFTLKIMPSGIEPATSCELANGLPLDHSVTPKKKLSEKIWKNTYSTQFFMLSMMAVLVFPQEEQKFWEKEGNFKIWHFELTFEAPNETGATSPTTPVCLQNESFRMSYRWALYDEARGRHDFVLLLLLLVVVLLVRA